MRSQDVSSTCTERADSGTEYNCSKKPHLILMNEQVRIRDGEICWRLREANQQLEEEYVLLAVREDFCIAKGKR